MGLKVKIRRCWAAAYQRLQKYSDTRNICEKNLPGRFEDWMYKECGMEKQTTYNYKNLVNLMEIAPKLMNCRVNMTYFVINHDILFNYFSEENEEQPQKHIVTCNCKVCNSYFT